MGTFVRLLLTGLDAVAFVAVLTFAAASATGQSTHLVADITTTPRDSWPEGFTEVNGIVFFRATDEFGVHLWRTDGTEPGTVRLTSPSSSAGEPCSAPFNLTHSGGRLFFFCEGALGTELWESDGTPNGTVRIAVTPGAVGLTAAGDLLFFAVTGQGPASGLWTSDGSAAGTVQLDSSPRHRFPSNFTVLGETLFFTDYTALWKSDGTPAGTVPVVDLWETGIPGSLTSAGGKLFFVVSAGIGDRGLWISDGTATGTMPLTDSGADPAGHIDRLTDVGGTLFFTWDRSASARGSPVYHELWKSDGTVAGTVLVTRLDRVAVGFRNVGGVLFFIVSKADSRTLWRSDGSAAGTVPVSSLPRWLLTNVDELTHVDGTLFFQARDPSAGVELWKSDGTDAGTVRVADLQPGRPGSRPRRLTAAGTLLYFSATDDAGEEIWRSDGTAAGTVRVADIARGSADSIIAELTDADGRLFFSAAGELWTSDATTAGTVRLTSGIVGPAELVPFKGALYFHSSIGATTVGQLWKSDGTAPGTRLVTDIGYLQNIVGVPAGLFFTDGLNGVWTSDGTTADTKLVWEMEGPPFCGGPATGCGNLPSMPGLIGLEDQLYFTALDTLGVEPTSHGLWMSGGTPESTVRIMDVRVAFDRGPGFGGAVSIGGTIFFPGRENSTLDVPTELELWKIDASRTRAERVADINPGPSGSDPTAFLRYKDRLFFSATEASGGREPWQSDGTAEGTVRVADVNAGAGDSAPSDLTDVDGTLYFSAFEPSGGRELWRSDGTPAGTMRVADINSGDGGSDPRELTNVAGAVYFSAFEPSGGRELWRSDGTPGGTVRAADIFPGPIGSDPEQIVLSGAVVFFTAKGPLVGRELWAHELCADGADADADGRCDAVDACTSVGDVSVRDPLVRLLHIGRPSGDDRLLVDGRLAAAAIETIDPIASGLRVALSDSGGGMLVDATLPGGAYHKATRTGWRLRRGAWLYRDPSGIHGIKRARIQPVSQSSTLRVTVKGTNGNYHVSPESMPLKLTLVIDGLGPGRGDCGEAAFDAVRCAFSSSGDELTCH